jgi:Transposase DDE domain group 1
VVLDVDSTEIPAYGEQEHSAYNGHFESTCHHPLVRHARYYWLLLADGHLNRRRFAAMLGWLVPLPVPTE